MLKIVENTFNFDQPRIQILRPKSRDFKKTASDKLVDYTKHIKKEAGRTKLLALFLGAGEYYGANRNGDWFGEKDLIEKHATFKTSGHVYKHHKNKDPNKKYGDVDFVTYNPRMKRVEGVMSIIDDKCPEILEKVANEEDIAVSMAAKLKYDVCSICGNKAPSFEKYCSDLRYDMNKILPDGRRVYAINPDPEFFDISLVFRPADPTAYVLKKVANFAERNRNNEIILLDTYREKKPCNCTGVLEKLSELEKKVEGIASEKIKNTEAENFINGCVQAEEIPRDIMNFMKSVPLDRAIGSLNKENILLTLKEFLELIGKDGMLEEVIPELPGSFSRLRDGEVSDVFGGDMNPIPLILDMLKPLISKRSLSGDNLKHRVLDITIRKPPVTKVYSTDGGLGITTGKSKKRIVVKKSSSEPAKRVADIYNLYKMSFFMRSPSPHVGLAVTGSNYFVAG